MSARTEGCCISACDLKRAAIKATNWKTFVSKSVCQFCVFLSMFHTHFIFDAYVYIIIYCLVYVKSVRRMEGGGVVSCRISFIHNRVSNCLLSIYFPVNCLNIEWMKTQFFLCAFRYASSANNNDVSIPSSL